MASRLAPVNPWPLGAEMDAKWWWLIGMIGPFGVMAFARVAADAYNNWRSAREPQLEIASTEQVEALAPTLSDLMPKVLGYAFEDCVITDQSSLSDFAGDEEDLQRFRENIRECYGLDAGSLPDDRLVTIAGAIARGRA